MTDLFFFALSMPSVDIQADKQNLVTSRMPLKNGVKFAPLPKLKF